jgi:hypothetical protein
VRERYLKTLCDFITVSNKKVTFCQIEFFDIIFVYEEEVNQKTERSIKRLNSFFITLFVVEVDSNIVIPARIWMFESKLLLFDDTQNEEKKFL